MQGGPLSIKGVLTQNLENKKLSSYKKIPFLKMKIKNIILIAWVMLFLAPMVAEAQPLNASRPEYMLQVADEKFEAKDYVNALDFYTKYYDATKDRSVTYKMGLANMAMNDYTKAEASFSRSLQRSKASSFEAPEEARLYLGMMQKMNEKYDEALVTFEEFIKTSKDDAKVARAKSELEGAKMAMRMKENVKLTLENLGTKVNTPNSEYSPTISGNMLYFAALRDGKITVIDGKEGDFYAKIYRASISDKGEFDKPEPLSGDVNRLGSHQGNVSFSPDGQTMYFTRFSLSGNTVGESTIFFSAKQGDGTWGAAKEVAGVNGKWQAKHPAMGELYGKPVLFFTSNMESTKGGFDVFYANKVSEGEFSAPVNLGDVINTTGDDETPFYQNGKLYFSSNGHPTIGGSDIFVASWNGATWTKPENMGKGYNSPANDSYFTMDANGTALFTSNRKGGRSLKSTCCEDIYIVKAEPVVIDLVVDAFDPKKQPMKGLTYEFRDLSTKALNNTKTDDKYTSLLTKKRSYTIIVSKPGYYNDTLSFNTMDIDKTTTVKKTATMRPLAIISANLQASARADGQALSGVTYTLIEIASNKSDSRVIDIYRAGLPLNKSFRLIGSKAGFTGDTVTFNTNDIKETVTIEKMLNLKPKIITVKRNEKIALPNIFYKLDKFEANEAHMQAFDEAQRSLDYLYNIMAKYPELVIELGSHTDARGSDAYNLTLSQKRADGVKAYLVSKGIQSDKIIAKGYGETQLVNRCGNGVKCEEDEHLQNRRTEFKIVSGPTSIEITEQQPAGRN
jgi:outer membrane protein OmpA-like peptidoglycan-associated protein/tetratricopeptide (TPR) repeat protein